MSENKNRKRNSEQKKNSGFGVWVYCIRRVDARALKNPAPEQVRYGAGKISGIQPGTKVYAVAYKDIEAVVSEVDIRQFGEKEILEKLERDTKWTERSVKLHHDIIVTASGDETAIPLKFGTIFRTRKNLEAMLKKSYRKFKTLLNQLKGKEEWGVKVYLDKQKFVEEVKEEDEEIRQFEKRKVKAPEGMKWYADRKIDEVIRKKFGDAVEKYLSKIVEELEWQAEKVVINESTPKEVTGREMVLSSACLIKKEAVESFKEKMGKFFEDLGEIGFSAEITGPWPPYNFVEIKK